MTGSTRCKSSFSEPIVELIQEHGDDHHGTDNDLAVVLVNAQNHNAAADHLNDQCTEERTQCGTFAAGQAGASDDGGGNDVEFVTLAIARRARAVVTEGEQCRNSSGKTSDNIDAQLDALDPDAAEAAGELIAANRVDASPGGESC